MNRYIPAVALCLWIFCTSFTPVAVNPSAETKCISAEEKKLYELINTYRKQHKLPAIPLSAAMCTVARTHVKDLAEHYKNPMKNKCNMHTWSDKGTWSSCCYTSDHAKASCMWNKPRELTHYKGDGYEIAYYFSDKATAQLALEGWKDSPSHNDVILSKSIWKAHPWKAVGVGIYGNYAVAWFGRLSDTASAPDICK